ncbi:MAG: hypothetical protein GEV10_09720 [Streptosporangiales bacterium]|nr:hypothetical protein [Streptosporangiales bacterium]
METANPTVSPTADSPEFDVARTYEDAALYLEYNGWCQGDLFKHTGDPLPLACVLGALNIVTFSKTMANGERSLVAAEHVGRVIDDLADYLDDGIWRDDVTPRQVVWSWNDHPDTTQAQVIRTLRNAAKRHHTTAGVR